MISSIVLVFIFVNECGGYLNALSATITVKRLEGMQIFDRLMQRRSFMCVPPNGTGTEGGCNYANSTEMINSLFESRGGSDSGSFHEWSQEKNIWIVVDDVPSNAPPNFIVMATRNVDPKSLKLRLTSDEMDGKIKYLKSEKRGILNTYALLYRKDGTHSVKAFSWFRSSKKRDSYRNIYGHQPFDLTTNGVSVRSVRYLTPVGEIIVDDKANNGR